MVAEQTLNIREIVAPGMAPSIWEGFVARLRGGEAEEDDTRFVPSPLDLSVRVGHGGQDRVAARELRAVRERAEELEEGRPEN
jgi:hypothetical protein